MKKNSMKKSFIPKLALAWLMTLILLMTAFALDMVKDSAASADSKIGKLLFFVNSAENYNSILDWQNEGAETNDNLYGSDSFDIHLLSEVNTINLSSYLAVALPYETNRLQNKSRQFKIQNAFDNGTYVYLYGDLTINDYKDAVGLEDFSLNVDINGSGDGIVTQAKQYFDSEYEEEEVFNVIGYSKKALLCKITDKSIAAYTYLFNVVQNFEILTRPVPFSTTIRSEFDFSFSWTIPNNGIGIVHMDYVLYQNYSEQDPIYDYFGVSTKVWVTKSSPLVVISGFNTKYDLPFANDNLSVLTTIQI